MESPCFFYLQWAKMNSSWYLSFWCFCAVYLKIFLPIMLSVVFYFLPLDYPCLGNNLLDGAEINVKRWTFLVIVAVSWQPAIDDKWIAANWWCNNAFIYFCWMHYLHGGGISTKQLLLVIWSQFYAFCLHQPGSLGAFFQCERMPLSITTI